MQELFFWLGGLGWLHFCHRKGHNLTKNENIEERQKS